MDEVDFTILAATSVFTDLIEKCPPAEACRDAFDRTGKATVKMATQTGGFGQAALRQSLGARGSHDYLTSHDATANRHRQQQHQQRLSLDSPGSRTAYAQYDLSVPDGYASNRRTAQAQLVQTSPFQLSMPNVKTEKDSYSLLRGVPRPNQNAGNMVPDADTSAIDPVLLPSPSAAQPGQSPISVSSITPVSAHAALPSAGMSNFMRSPSAMNTPGQVSFTGLQDMAFLQSLQGTTGMDGDAIGDGGQGELSFGLGWDGTHQDFNDGPQVDLLDGFWFGGQQSGGGGAAAGNGVGMP
jgi:hypothetical protein